MTSIGHTTVLRSQRSSRCSLHHESWNAFISNRSRSTHEDTHSLERTSVCIGMSWMHSEQVIQPWGALAAKGVTCWGIVMLDTNARPVESADRIRPWKAGRANPACAGVGKQDAVSSPSTQRASSMSVTRAHRLCGSDAGWQKSAVRSLWVAFVSAVRPYCTIGGMARTGGGGPLIGHDC
jgi:hypothetical protein